MSTAFAWTLVFHITGIVFWIGGLLMAAQVLGGAAQDEAEVASAQPVAVAAAATGGESSAASAAPAVPAARAIHQRTAMRMMRNMAHPGALLTLATGIILLMMAGHANPAIYQAPWLNIKLILVAIMLWLDFRLWVRVKGMDHRPARRKDASMLHGFISLAFFVILILVFLKP